MGFLVHKRSIGSNALGFITVEEIFFINVTLKKMPFNKHVAYLHK